MPKPEKIEAVAALKKLFEESDSMFVTDYQGLNVADITVLRRQLSTKNVRYLIAKNTLMRIAAVQAGVKDLDRHFSGPTAVAFAQDDPAVAAKILYDSYKDHDLPRMKAFIVDNDYYDGSEIQRLAELPSRPVLLSHLVAAVEAPFSGLVGSLDGFFRGLVGVIDALGEKRKSEA
jgi:large subunit ribosomal protein L10